jgi:hypothetical protein
MRRGGGAGGTRADTAADSPLLYALTGFTASNYYATPSGGGEAGPGASSWGLATLLRVRAFQAGEHQRIAVRGAAGGLGWHQYLFTTNQIIGYFNNGAGWTNTAGPTLQPSDLGKLLLLLTWLDAGGVPRLALNRLEMVTAGATPSASYTAQSGPHAIGYSPADGTNGAQTIDILGHLSFSGVPSNAQLQAFFDAARVAGDMPALLAGATVRHRWSLRDQLAKIGGAVVSGQTAPPQLDDTVTGAVGDVMTRVGAPTVRVIDPSVDGRATKGVLGFSAGSGLQTAAGQGIRGSATFCVGLKLRVDASAPGTEYYASALSNNAPGYGGWDVSLVGGSASLGIRVCDAAGSLVSAPAPALTTGDRGQMLYVFLVLSGGTARTYLARGGIVAEVGAGVSVTGYKAGPGTEPMRVGAGIGGALPLLSGSWFGLQGGNVAPTLAQLQQCVSDSERLGGFAALPGAEHFYEPTQDITAANSELPAQVLDRIGTDHLARVDIDTPKVGPNGILGVGPYTAVDLWRTALGGGLQGAATGHHVVIDLTWIKQPTSREFLACCLDAGGAVSGWLLDAGISNSLRFSHAGTGLTTAQTGAILTAGIVGTRWRILLMFTGTALQIWVNGVKQAEAATTTFNLNAANTIAMFVGSNQVSSLPATSAQFELVQGGSAVLSAGEVTALFADLTQPPPIVAGKTLKRWRFEDDIAANGGKVPRTSDERIAGGDSLGRFGGGLQVAQRVERAWSYETSPILRGAQAFSVSDYFEHPVGVAGDPNTGLFAAVLLVVRSQAVPSTGRVILSRRSTSSSGWNVSTNATNSTISATLSTTTSTYGTPAFSIAASDVGKLQLFVFQLDVALLKLRSYGKRAEVAGGSTVAGTFVPYAGTMQVGRRNADVVAADAGIEIYGFTCGESLLTLAEIQALHDACMASEDIVAVPGKSLVTVSLKQDIANNNGAIPATLIDRTGSSNFSRVGAPALANQYSRAWGW